MKVYSLLIAFNLIFYYIDGARILGIYPMASVSHQVVFRSLTLELAKRGHELVVVTPNPALPKDRPRDNVTEIDTSDSYRIMKHIFEEAPRLRGVIIPGDDVNADKYQVIFLFLKNFLENPEFKSLLEDPNQKFDLIIGEALYMLPTVFGKIYNAPVIWFSSFYGHSTNYAAMGAPTRHPLLHPNLYRIRLFNLTFWEKIVNIYKEWKMWYQMNKLMYIEENFVKQYFNDKAPTAEEMLNSIDLLFVNANPLFEGNRPVPPNVIHLGGMHLNPVKELPLDLKSYLDESSCGVIYLSLGSNVRFALMEPDLVNTFIDAVEEMSYNVLWKFDGEDLPRIPKNARIGEWFPQRDLLHHPNVKAFITQGGLQSADETIDAGVPVVVLPAIADQWYNAEQYERLGVGIHLDMLTLEAKELVKAVKTVVEDVRYRQKMQSLGDIMRDQMQTPLERAVWWTEYTIRHGGAKHLRSPAANISLQEYFMLDVVLPLVVVVLLVLFSFALVVRLLKLRFKVKTH